jgi:hypothetical protein
MDFSGGSATSTSGGASGGSVWIFTETADVTGMYLYLIYNNILLNYNKTTNFTQFSLVNYVKWLTYKNA